MLTSCGILNHPPCIRTGTIISYAIRNWKEKGVPKGFLPCFGQKISKIDYSELYYYVKDNMFGLPYAGDLFFYIPDLRRRYVTGVGPNRYLGQLLESNNPKHNHPGRCTDEGSAHVHYAPTFNVGHTRNGTAGTGYRSFGGSAHMDTKLENNGKHKHENVKGGSVSDGGCEEFRPNTSFVLFAIKY